MEKTWKMLLENPKYADMRHMCDTITSFYITMTSRIDVRP